MNINGRKVQRFRCTVDPMIPPKPRNAFDNSERGDCKGWDFELTPAGMYIKAVFIQPGDRQARIEEHLIPYGNIQSVKLLPLPASEKDEKPPKG